MQDPLAAGASGLAALPRPWERFAEAQTGGLGALLPEGQLPQEVPGLEAQKWFSLLSSTTNKTGDIIILFFFEAESHLLGI